MHHNAIYQYVTLPQFIIYRGVRVEFANARLTLAQELRTERHNFTVQPLANGATTKEQWSFTDQPTGQTFKETPVPRSGANQIFLIYWAIAMPLLFLVFLSSM
jgi:hypothetical protein